MWSLRWRERHRFSTRLTVFFGVSESPDEYTTLGNFLVLRHAKLDCGHSSYVSFWRPTGRLIFSEGELAENSDTHADIILRTPSGIPVHTRKSDLSARSFPCCCVDTCIRVLIDRWQFCTSFLGSFRFLLTFVMRLFLVPNLLLYWPQCLPRQWIHVLRPFYTKAGLRFQSAVRTLNLLIVSTVHCT